MNRTPPGYLNTSWTDEVSCCSKEIPNFFTCNGLYNWSFRRQVLLSYIDGLDVFAKKQSHARFNAYQKVNVTQYNSFKSIRFNSFNFISTWIGQPCRIGV
jgi:hypothetical protein